MCTYTSCHVFAFVTCKGSEGEEIEGRGLKVGVLDVNNDERTRKRIVILYVYILTITMRKHSSKSEIPYICP